MEAATMPISFLKMPRCVVVASRQGRGCALAGHLSPVSVMVETVHPVGTHSVVPTVSSFVLRQQQQQYLPHWVSDKPFPGAR